jgi:hypothetical protein
MRGGRCEWQRIDSDDREVHFEADVDPGRSRMIDFNGLLLDPLYDAFGVEASLEASGTVTLTVIDDTQGVILDTNTGLQFAAAKPAARVRMSELAANNIAREDLKDAAISFNGGDWTIVATQPKPTSSGASELYLILQAA